MTLGRCLESLRWNQQQQAIARAGGQAAPPRVVPYRESKVTHLFRYADKQIDIVCVSRGVYLIVEMPSSVLAIKWMLHPPFHDLRSQYCLLCVRVFTFNAEMRYTATVA